MEENIMSYSSIVISSGHGLHVRGASSDMLDEVDAARLVVEDLASALRTQGVTVVTFHDDTSTSQNENLNRITDFHNKQDRELDISVHFNAFEQCDKPMGTEVLYVTQVELADKMSAMLSGAGGFIDRGPKKNTGLHFLNQTDMPSILVEVCFVDSVADVGLFDKNYEAIIEAMAGVLSGEKGEAEKPDNPVAPPPGKKVIGKCSWFGGPDDTGVSASEGLAFIYEINDAPHLFLPYQPAGTSGLARRLNPNVHYIAMRWDYDVTSKTELLTKVVWVKSLASGVKLKAYPADWGPHGDTDRIADLSPGLMDDLELTTDDDVEVTWAN
jgi:N-acetylmuramoyl-L-alanine amidase